MIWNDEKYYLITYNSKHNSFTHYRVDKMSHVELLDQKQDPVPKDKKIDISNYTKNHFNMYSGEEKEVQIKCDNELADIIVDRFGAKIKLISPEETVSEYKTYLNEVISSYNE